MDHERMLRVFRGQGLSDPARLATLAATGLLDSDSEPRFDRLARMAAKFLGTPVALVSLVDDNRQFFKSCFGLPEPWATTRETPLTHSFCQYVVTTQEPLVVDDARLDPRLKDNLAIPDLGVIAYLGIPLAINGHVIGSFCAIDGKPRQWTPDEIATLHDLAESVISEILLRAEHEECMRHRLAAEDARSRLDNALTAGAIATWTWDIPEDRVVADAHLARLFSISAEDAGGGPLSLYVKAIHLDDVVRVGEVITGVVAQGSTFDEEYRVVQPDGSIRWVVARGNVERDEQGRAMTLSGAVVDITERKRADDALKLSEERYRTLFTSMDEGFAVIEMIYDDNNVPCNYRFLEVNPAFEALTGWKDVTGKTVRDITPDLESFWYETYDSVAKTGESVRFEHDVRALDARHFDVYVIRVGDATHPKVAVLFNDITGRKIVEKELERLVEQLRNADVRKDEFLAMLAHELRNPLAAITNASTLLRMSDQPDMAEYCKETIARQSAHLAHLIDDLLDVSRITHGKIVLQSERIDATTAIESAVQTVRPLVEARNHSLDVQIDRGHLWVEADATRLEQIVVNLLNNAAKYSENNGHIWLCARKEGQEISIRVKDAGVGIAPEKLPEMFELFAQADRSSARSEGGLGIGLTLVKRLVEMHGGTIAASSEGLGKGSEFVVRLPAAKRPAKLETPIAGPGAAIAPARFLVVDDNADTARSMARLLKLMGHAVTAVQNGPEAINAAQAQPPEVVLLDIGLPGMDGYEVARRLRQVPHCENAVIVAVSGYAQDLDSSRTGQAGFDHHLLKPIDLDALNALLARRPADARLTQHA